MTNDKEPSKSIRKPLEIEISISSDYYEATLALGRSEGWQDVEVNTAILEALARKNIVYGIDHNEIQVLLASGSAYGNIVVARGLVHCPGQDAYITPQVNFEGSSKPIVQDDGTVDFKNLLQVSAVAAGDALVVKTPVKEGYDGMTVTGKTIKHRMGKDVLWKYGENVSVSEDGNTLYAEISGIAKLIKDRITVSQHIEVDEVGPKTGNIYFGGDVHVKGSVLDGYTVHCDGDLHVDGVVEGAMIKARGDMTVSSGILGHGAADIVVDGRLTAKFIENAIVYAKGEIETGEIINSEVLCDSKIIVKGKKGLIIGGEITSKYMIEANQIGSKLGVITSINLGVDISAIQELKELKETIQELKIVESRILDRIPILQHNALIQPEVGFHEDILNQYASSLLSIQIDLEEKQLRLDVLMEALRNVNQGMVKINSIYPDTVVRIGDSKYFIDKALSACIISKEGDQVIAIGLDKPFDSSK